MSLLREHTWSVRGRNPDTLLLFNLTRAEAERVARSNRKVFKAVPILIGKCPFSGRAKTKHIWKGEDDDYQCD